MHCTGAFDGIRRVFIKARGQQNAEIWRIGGLRRTRLHLAGLRLEKRGSEPKPAGTL